jgi:hypothetical protein
MLDSAGVAAKKMVIDDNKHTKLVLEISNEVFVHLIA